MSQESVVVLQKLGISVSRETVSRIERFADLFEKWAGRINLVAPSTKAQLWDRHIADSAQLYTLIPKSKQIVDLGSGGGFPGIILAILAADDGTSFVNLVESNNKKAGFLRQALLETVGRGAVNAIRIEDASDRGIKGDIITARALASLDQLLVYSEPWFKQDSQCRAFFHKGRDYQAEIDKARDRWRFDLVIHPSAVESDSVILEVSDLSREI